jgi:hypothetical protein
MSEIYGITEYYRRHDDGSNCLRGYDYAQPRTLHRDDTLSNGLIYQSGSTRASEFIIAKLNFMNGAVRVVPPRIPLQLATRDHKRGVQPYNLEPGHVLQTGCVVLEEPYEVESLEERGDVAEWRVALSTGQHSASVRIPYDIEVAVRGRLDDISHTSRFGKFVLGRLHHLSVPATKNLSPNMREMIANYRG